MLSCLMVSKQDAVEQASDEKLYLVIGNLVIGNIMYHQCKDHQTSLYVNPSLLFLWIACSVGEIIVYSNVRILRGKPTITNSPINVTFTQVILKFRILNIVSVLPSA